MALVNIEVTFNDDGTANITLPSGKKMVGVDQSKIAEATLKLAEAMGPVLERHKPHSHIHLGGGKTEEHEHTHE